jgi:LysR family hca operon transcriptional activator
MHILRGELSNADVSVTSDYSPNLADAVACGKLDVAFLRAEPDFDLVYRTVRQKPLVVLMPSDHPLASRRAVRPQDLIGEPFIAMVGNAKMPRGVVDEYLTRSGAQLIPTPFADNPAMVVSLVASTRSVTLIPAYVQDLLPSTVIGRPLAGDVPTIALTLGYRRSNTSQILKFFLSHLDELIARVPRRS